jgi:phosphoglycerate dehydrogenase-like enzyme
VSTPHVGAATAETQMETAMAAIDLLNDYIKIARAS